MTILKKKKKDKKFDNEKSNKKDERNNIKLKIDNRMYGVF